MTRRILLHENATLDLHEHFRYLAQSNADQAFRFFDAAQQTFAALARLPGMGQAYESGANDIINIRKCQSKDSGRI
jgi:toxin ParE1/3/4